MENPEIIELRSRITILEDRVNELESLISDLDQANAYQDRKLRRLELEKQDVPY